MSAPESPDIDETQRPEGDTADVTTSDEPRGAEVASGEPLADTIDAVNDTTDAVVETERAVLETEEVVVETGEAVLETPALGDPVDGATGAPVVDGDEQNPRMDLGQLKAIVEALIFASPEPLTPRMLLKLLNDEPKEDVLAGIEAVKHDYESRPGLHVAEVAGGYQITTRPELHDWVRRLFHERTTQKLSVASLETLSVVAYKQPITQAEIGEIRGVNTSGVLTTLLERHLIKIVGRKNVIGRPFLYGTTREFLIRFGLKDVTDLPKIEDMAQQLGFEPPASLMEQNVPEDMLPLEEPAVDDGRAAVGGGPFDGTAAVVGYAEADERVSAPDAPSAPTERIQAEEPGEENEDEENEDEEPSR